MSNLGRVRSFMFSASMLNQEIDRLSSDMKVDLTNKPPQFEKDPEYHDQFDLSIRDEAAKMAQYYEVFYCLEKSARAVVTDVMKTAKGVDWFKDPFVPQPVLIEVKKRFEKETEEGYTRRSEQQIDYTTFGELLNIISTNWSDFEPVFKNKKAVERIMARLNNLRSPIAHCCPLAMDEVVRLHLTVKDWFRLMS